MHNVYRLRARGMRGPGLTAGQQAQLDAVQAGLPIHEQRLTAIEQTHRVATALDLAGWTRQVAVIAAAAAPNDAITSLASTAKGKSVRVAGGNSVGPRAVSIVEPGEKYTLTFDLSRGVNDPSSNTTLLRVACFAGDGTFISQISLPSVTMAAADPASIVTLELGDTTTDAAYKFAAGTRYVRPYINGGSQTTGAVDLHYISDFEPVIPSVAAEMAAAPAQDGPAGDDSFILINAAGALRRVTSDNLQAWIEAFMAPPMYSYPASKSTTGGVSESLIAPDDGLIGVDIANLSESDRIWVSFGSIAAGEHLAGSYPVDPLSVLSKTGMPKGRINVWSPAPVIVTADFTTRTPYNVNAGAAADEFVALVASVGAVTLTGPQSIALRDFWLALDAADVLPKMRALYNFALPNSARLINLASLYGVRADRNGDMVGTNWSHLTFDGIDDWLNPRLAVENGRPFQTLDHSMLAWSADTATQGTSRTALGNGVAWLTPNRTATTFGVRSSSLTVDPVAGNAGGMFTVCRTSAAGFLASRNKDAFVNVTRPQTENITRSMIIGGSNSAASGTQPYPASASYYQGGLKMAGFGSALTVAERDAIYDAFNAFFTAAAGFSA